MLGLISLAIIIGLIWLEIIVFGLVGDALGVGLTIIGVFITAAIGIRLFRISGQSTLKRIAEALDQGRKPLLEVADVAAIMLAAILLLIPGYATDALGFILFIPGLRTVIMVILLTLLHQFLPSITRSRFAFSSNHQNDSMNQNAPDQDIDKNDASNITIEGDYKRHD